METLKLKNEEPTNLICEIMGNSKHIQTWQMKHGISCERHAKIKYQHLARKLHKRIKFNTPGMTVLETDPYISASPEVEIDCECHGKGVVEIKCLPSIPNGETPSPSNYKHFEMQGDVVCLKKTSEYYYQVQGQITVTKRLLL